MAEPGCKIPSPELKVRGNSIKYRELLERNRGTIYTIIALSVLALIWYIVANQLNNTLLLPYFQETAKSFFAAWTDPKIMSNLAITLRRVFAGFLWAVVIGLPLGLLMGYSSIALQAISPVINSVRQVPIMAWVPLSIIWFGLGDGPTVFLITMSAVFPLIINTIAGVHNIDPNFYHAARSMGAKPWQIVRDIIVPGAMPHILTGCRLAMGLGWMSVICAEFIATSSGFGFLMVEAQARLETELLYALMFMSAIVGFAIDKLLLLLEHRLTSWRFKNGVATS